MRSYREAGSPIPRDNEIMLRRSIRRNSNVPAINKSSSETPPRFIGPAYRPRVFSWWALLALLFPRIIPACRIPAASMDVSSRRSQEPLDLIDGISFPERISLNLGVLGGATRCKAPMYPNGVRQDDYPLGSLEATRRQAGSGGRAVGESDSWCGEGGGSQSRLRESFCSARDLLRAASRTAKRIAARPGRPRGTVRQGQPATGYSISSTLDFFNPRTDENNWMLRRACTRARFSRSSFSASGRTSPRTQSRQISALSYPV